MAFKKKAAEEPTAADPERLYPLLPRGAGAPAGLWVHQAEILRSWHGTFMNSSDVAVELPTGAGKTLVGGLVAEFRRRSQRERVAFVCPTRQLARQTADKLTQYGVRNVLLTGKVREFNAADRALYTSARAVGVTVYSHIFNSNSAFSDAQFLVLDDAHAGEGPVASAWSIRVPRESAAYRDVLSTLSDAIDPLVLQRLWANAPDGQFFSHVYLASPLGVLTAAGQLEQVLQAAVASNAVPRDVGFNLRLMTGHLGHCMVYVSYSSILIRPLIAPTATLESFSGAAQRFYMSATLGAGGELERSFGRQHISRIPVPTGWDKQGTGRRFFAFPELAIDLADRSEQADEWVQQTIAEAGRAVVLTPDSRTADKFIESRLPTGIAQVRADDVEEDLSVFTGKSSAALVLTNRYDGVDLPDDDCRLVVLQGLPARGDLQERFLYSSLGALEVLQERIRARIVQGAGRATRNSGDFATVLLLGADLIAFCSREDVQAALHPEVHAELEFGLSNSLAVTSEDITDNIRIFNEHGAEWLGVEAEIVAERDKMSRQEPAGTEQLAAAAGAEVSACLALWQGETDRALEFAKMAIDSLRGGRVSQRYAALWNYLAACWAGVLAAQQQNQALYAASAAYYKSARAAGRGTTWLIHLAAPADSAVANAAEEKRDPLDVLAATNVLSNLSKYGKATRFDTDVAVVRTSLLATEAKPYEDALVHMGWLAGADPSDPNGGATAAPDAAWLYGSLCWVAWEAKSDAKADGELGANDVRQAGSHLRYISNYREEGPPSGSFVIVVTPQSRVQPAAKAVAEGHVYVVGTEPVLAVFDRLVRAWRQIRAAGGDLSVEEVYDLLHREEALPSQWFPVVMQQSLGSAPDS